jgi:hypothetical protein
VKTPQQLTADITNRLKRTWSQTVATTPAAAEDIASAASTAAWPHMFPLGAPTRDELERRFSMYQAATLTWRRWHSEHADLGIELAETTRRVHGTSQPVPTHVRVPDADAAAALVGAEWVQRLARARARTAVIRDRFAPQPDLERLLREVDSWTDVDFGLLCAAAAWFAERDAAGLTPRQVPIAGMHAKWLNTRRHLVAALAGREQLRLAPSHPPRVHLTYLDPDHRAAGGRRHDCISVGDNVELPYVPAVVVISENKDTAVAFPQVPAGVAVEGGGFGGGTAAAMNWLTGAPVLVYWGDIDAAGFEILDGFRAAGVRVASMLMDMATFEAYEQFGTNLDRRGTPIEPGNRRDLAHLTEAERAMYRALTDPAWSRHRRLEQERIPLADALDALTICAYSLSGHALS